MRDLGLKSATSSAKFIGIESLSYFNSAIYLDFSTQSYFDNGSFYDYSLASEIMDRSGDFGISSSYTKTPTGGFSLVSSFIESSNVMDMSLSTQYKSSIFTSMSFTGVMSKVRRTDFSISSKITRTLFLEMSKRSTFIRRSYSDFPLKSSISQALHVDTISFGLESSYKQVEKHPLPRRIDLSEYLNDSIFSINVSSISLEETSYNIGKFNLQIDYEVQAVYSRSMPLSIVNMYDLNDVVQTMGSIVSYDIISLDGLVSAPINISFEYQPLLEVNSGIIEFSLKRDLIEYSASNEDALVMDLLFKKIDLRYKEMNVNVQFANQQAMFVDANYVNMITLPGAEEELEESILIEGFKSYFGVSFESSLSSPLWIGGIVFNFDLVGGNIPSHVSNLINRDIRFLEQGAAKYEISNSLLLDSVTMGKKIVSGFVLDDVNTNEPYTDSFVSNDDGEDVEYQNIKIITESKYSILTKYERITDEYSLVEDSLYVTTVDSSYCSSNGHTVAMTGDPDFIFVSPKISEGKIVLTPGYSDVIDITGFTQGMGSFILNPIINLDGISTDIELSEYQYGFIDSFEDFYSYAFVSISVDSFIEGLLYDGSFKYTDKIDIDGIESEPQELNANLMYNAIDIYSYESRLLVVADV